MSSEDQTIDMSGGEERGDGAARRGTEGEPATGGGESMRIGVGGAVGVGGGVPGRIGKYHITGLIATGGMGSVYRAVQEKPHRTVAVKVMRRGIASRSALRRFEYESQLLARLRHPHIAEVYEAGTEDLGEGGVPYFVMEFIVTAKRITDYAAEKQLSTRDRLNLFLSVCDAIHHGHSKGVIHRDLKPDNIMVDSSGRVKVIDFGVARATDSDLAVTTQQTDIGQLIGTVQYMSPEQVEGEPEDLDTRSDVYSLGVVLYELLTGKLPYDVRGAKVFEATRLIREQPAARLSTIDHSLRGDVETIVLKALEKDRERRYQTARGLKIDIEHFLNSEPINARPPSITYQARMFARRNKVLVGGVVGVFATVVAGLVVAVVLWGQAETARGLAERREVEAKTEAEKAQRVVGLLKGMLETANPAAGRGVDYTVREMLRDFSGTIGGEMADQPEAELEIRTTIGDALWRLRDFGGSVREFNRALELAEDLYGAEDERTADVIVMLTRANPKAGRAEEAMAEALRAKAIYEKAGNLMGMALAQLEYASAHMLVEERSEERVRDYREAARLAREATGGADDPRLAVILHNLAGCLSWVGRTQEADPIAKEAVAMHSRLRDADDPERLWALKELGDILFNLRKLEEAEPVVRELYERRRRLYDEDHDDKLRSGLTYAQVLVRMNRLDESYAVLSENRMGGGSEMMFERAVVYARMGRFDEAVGECRRSLDAGLPSPMRSRLRVQMALGMLGAGDRAGFEREAWDLIGSAGGSGIQSEIGSVAELIGLLTPRNTAERERLEAAGAWLEREKTAAPAYRRNGLLTAGAAVLYRLGDFEGALARLGSFRGGDRQSVMTAMTVRSLVYSGMGRRAEAAAELERVHGMLDGAPRAGESDLGTDWGVWVVLRELDREATALLGEH